MRSPSLTGTPHVAVLYGAHPDGDFRPKMLQQNMPGAHDFKIMKLMEGRSLSVGHPKLIAAYDAQDPQGSCRPQFRLHPGPHAHGHAGDPGHHR